METKTSSRTGIQAPADFLGSDQGLQPALHPLPRYSNGTEFSDRSPDRKRARHHRADCRFRESHPGAERRRAALPFRHFPSRALCHGRGFAWPWRRTERWSQRKSRSKIVEAGVKRVSISLDGADAADARYLPRNSRSIRSRHLWLAQSERARACRCRSTRPSPATMRTSCPTCSKWRRSLGADALHTFLLVPVGCGVDIASRADGSAGRIRADAELVLRSLAGRRDRIEGNLRAALLPRGAAAPSGGAQAAAAAAARAAIIDAVATWPGDRSDRDGACPGSDRIIFKPKRKSHRPSAGHPGGHPGGHPDGMNAMTKGCLAGTGVCFISHEGEVFPCGYLPAIAGDLRKAAVCRHLERTRRCSTQLRDTIT